MTKTAIRRTTGLVVGALVVAAGAAISATPAHADPGYDQKFIEYLDDKGVPFENRTEIIKVAKQFCLDMGRQGSSTWKAGYHLMKDHGWTQSQAENFIHAAVPTYCPGAWG